MQISLEYVIGWQDSYGKTLCDKCFIKEFKGHYPSEWEPIFDEGRGETLYECDHCKERFTD